MTNNDYSSSPDILYHYCSTQAFYSIIENRSIWLSSMKQSTDYMEGKLVSLTIKRLAEKSNVDSTITDTLYITVNSIEEILDGMAFCLSEDGDLLSQWRGYASDATGVAIGFSVPYLHWLMARLPKDEITSSLSLSMVQYDDDSQNSLVEPTFLEIVKLIEQGAFKRTTKRSLLDDRTDEEIKTINKNILNATMVANIRITSLWNIFFILKARAFIEEKEWRLLSLRLMHDPSKDECLHRVVKDQLVPYYPLRLLESDEFQTITKIILGPKHRTPTKVIEKYLNRSGFGKVEVIRSNASYR